MDFCAKICALIRLVAACVLKDRRFKETKILKLFLHDTGIFVVFTKFEI